MYDKSIFGKRVKELRKEKQLKQSELAAILGLKTSMISEIENGKYTTTVEKLIILADYFNVTIDYLVGRTNKQ